MKRRQLGRSGLVVSEICLGTMTFGSMADESQSMRILDKALDAGRGKAMTARFVNEATLESTERLALVAEECQMSIATFSTAWTPTHDFVGSTVIGATAPAQLDDMLAAAEVHLTADAIEACNRISREIRYPMG